MPTSPSFDLLIRNAHLVNADSESRADIGISDGRIVAVGPGLAPGRQTLDATGLHVFPGGVDSHCHIDEASPFGVTCADDFESATASAAAGGTTTVIPFAVQHRGKPVRAALQDYAQRARGRAAIDHAFHLIVTDPSVPGFEADIAHAVAQGVRSIKVYMTYEAMRLRDDELLDMLVLADRYRLLLMVHAENHEVIQWLTRKLLARGHVAPRFHGVSHAELAEAEATHRMISLSRLLDIPVLLVHVAAEEATRLIRAGQSLGAPVLAETCPHYLLLTAQDLDKPGLEGAKWCCSPPPRGGNDQEALWEGLRDGVFQVVSSDHAPYTLDEKGKFPLGEATTFKDLANGMPGLQTRMALLFHHGVGAGRITLQDFVRLTSTAHARLYGLFPRKGLIAPGADADLVLWDPSRRQRLSASIMLDRTGYTPYEGWEVQGWPQTVISRGQVVAEDGRFVGQPGAGSYLACEIPEPVRHHRPGAGRAGFLRQLLELDT